MIRRVPSDEGCLLVWSAMSLRAGLHPLAWQWMPAGAWYLALARRGLS